MDRINKADFFAGLLFTLFGAGFGITALDLEIGTTLRMGPGYFPLMLSVLLVLFGIAIMGTSFRSMGEAVGPYAWRGMVYILGAPVFFALTLRGAGFVPSIFATTLIAARAALKLPTVQAIGLAAGVTIFCTMVFSYALGLPFRNIGPWLSVFGG